MNTSREPTTTDDEPTAAHDEPTAVNGARTPAPGPVPGGGLGGGPRSRPGVPRAVPLREGPLLIEGPLEIVLPDGETRLCERPVIALCTCRRSLRAPFCDTSHRPRERAVRGKRHTPGKDAKDAEDRNDPDGTHDADGADRPDGAPDASRSGDDA
ncbi:CDGSH iron-sulfur domain-containing protein [Streptomyces sp.]|uniref:CDGSH iron-sulfur domain-containing protein n=1 Tax=Streptomyces sp. TaxID=1931 RepID=UPI00281169E8|nr:CDGSH iron-sulfur domain-containing protein [Streptomyces sp.]